MTVAILGAGATGLAIAHRLCRLGISVRLLETSSQVGGVIQSFKQNEFLAEAGPHSLRFSSNTVHQLLKEIGLEAKVTDSLPAAKKRFLVHRSRLTALPQSLSGAITTPLLSVGAKLRILCEPFISVIDSQSEESLATFVARRLGKEVLEKMVDPFVSGIYAGDPHRLVVRYALPQLWQLEQQYGSLLRGALAVKRARQQDTQALKSRIISFPNGMQTLIDALAESISESCISTSITLNAIQYLPESKTWQIRWQDDHQIQEACFDELVLTLPAHRFVKLPFINKNETTGSLINDPDWQLLNSIPYAPVALLTLGFHRESVKHSLDGFGVLIPESEKRRILGVIFASSVFPKRAPPDHVTLSVFIGGARHPEYIEQTETELKTLALEELHSLLGVSDKPVYARLVRWPQAIPQYEMGYGKYLKAMENLESKWLGLHFAGNYRCGVSLTQCLEDGLRQADGIASRN